LFESSLASSGKVEGKEKYQCVFDAGKREILLAITTVTKRCMLLSIGILIKIFGTMNLKPTMNMTKKATILLHSSIHGISLKVYGMTAFWKPMPILPTGRVSRRSCIIGTTITAVGIR